MNTAPTTFTQSAGALLILAGYMGLIYLQALGWAKVDAVVLQGFLSIVMLVVGWVWGSSTSSARKDATIAAQAARAAPQVSPPPKGNP